ncbi:MAG: insulinase family protein, partial [Cyanothece sp. SIO1E1]|nr:insulinase family protein [Cyanothece sp. SIO1E1]
SQKDLQESYAFYRDRFADAGDFTFIFVGAFDLESLRPLVKQYLASLPTTGRKESWRDVGVDKITGQNEVVVHKGIEPKSSVRISFYGPAEWSYYEQYVLGAMIDVLRIPMREALREDKGGVYGVSVRGSMSRFPSGEFSTGISFGCDPEKADELIETALNVVKKIQTEGPDPEDLAAVKEMHLRGIETSVRQNGFWISALQTYTQNGIDFDAVNQRVARTESLTAELIQEAAVKYFDDSNRLIAKLLPEIVESAATQ